MEHITIKIQNTQSGRFLARCLQIMDESGCTMGQAMDRVQMESDHNLLDRNPAPIEIGDAFAIRTVISSTMRGEGCTSETITAADLDS